ncbi:MAG: hypothetical protein HYY50_01635 [Candidatus Kerfeldbacteria bacterium]|nr:hypothetical protein [Candidatus Kerfeldbacteria bacterium]
MMPVRSTFAVADGSFFVAEFCGKYRHPPLLARRFVGEMMSVAHAIDELDRPYDERQGLVQLLDTLTALHVHDGIFLQRSLLMMSLSFVFIVQPYVVWGSLQLGQRLAMTRLGVIGLSGILTGMILMGLQMLFMAAIRRGPAYRQPRQSICHQAAERYQAEPGLLTTDLELLAGHCAVPANVYRPLLEAALTSPKAIA